MIANYKMNPIYAARIARTKAEAEWKAVDRNPNSTTDQRIKAFEAYQLAKANYRAAFKQDRGNA